jgi:hypothetical protein
LQEALLITLTITACYIILAIGTQVSPQRPIKTKYSQFRGFCGAGFEPFNAVEDCGEDIISASETLSPDQASFTALIEGRIKL